MLISMMCNIICYVVLEKIASPLWNSCLSLQSETLDYKSMSKT